MADAHVLISSQTIASPVSSVTFGSGGTLSQAYRDLILVCDLNFTSTGTASDIYVRLNNDSTSGNYPNVYVDGNGTSASSASSTNRTGLTMTYWDGSSGTRNLNTMHILDYSQTDKQKTALLRQNNPNVNTAMWILRWASTSAVTTLSVVFQNANNFPAGCTFNLYGVSA